MATQNIKQKRQYFHQLLIRLGEVKYKEIIVEAEFGVSSTSKINEPWKMDKLIKAAEARLQKQNNQPQKTPVAQEQKQLRKLRNKCLLVLNERGIIATPKDWSMVNDELAKKQYQWVMSERQRLTGIINRRGLYAFRTVEDLKKLFNQLCSIRDNEKAKAKILNDLALKN